MNYFLILWGICMLLWLLFPLHKYIGALNVFKYITFRAFGAIITGIVLSMMAGPWFIRYMKRKQIGQTIRDDGPQSHLSKKGTPTMGGGLILFCIGFSTLLWADLTNKYIWVIMFATFATGILGWTDDYRKVIQKNSKGVSGRQKLFWQSIIALAVGTFLYLQPDFFTRSSVSIL
jgi:phospho-N-acetylmuramoyl-pentapeptide-transferase